jgi:hypothetical protein
MTSRLTTIPAERRRYATVYNHVKSCLDLSYTQTERHGPDAAPNYIYCSLPQFEQALHSPSTARPRTKSVPSPLMIRTSSSGRLHALAQQKPGTSAPAAQTDSNQYVLPPEPD